ncbi:unnamed protein product [Sphagnum troendelagicum]|uniref:Uncharacterized protein n=1 Tax=Sphagnum troendelagicum TaxID=128251 RepID=A0ABP0TNU3_9BRYO
MNGDGQTLVDGRLWMDVRGQKGLDGWTLVDGHLWTDVGGWKGSDGWNHMEVGQTLDKCQLQGWTDVK